VAAAAAAAAAAAGALKAHLEELCVAVLPRGGGVAIADVRVADRAEVADRALLVLLQREEGARSFPHGSSLSMGAGREPHDCEASGVQQLAKSPRLRLFHGARCVAEQREGSVGVERCH
jgi:hypothetical protein